MATPPNILSLDGGGIRGISSLQILQAIMDNIRETRNLSEVPRPCEVFDVIGGTSTGGIIAIMLGRLGMTINECIVAYRALAKKAFTPRRRLPIPGSPKGAYSTAALEDAIKHAIEENCKDPGCLAQKKCDHSDKPFRDETCAKTIVLALTKKNAIAGPTLFRTYDTSNDFKECTIWQVARATSAATTFFRSIKLGRNKIEFIDPALGYNNPCEVLIEESAQLFPSAREFRILSIGTGLGGLVRLKDTRKSILHVLKVVGTGSNRVADRLEAKYRDTSQYFRFNVDHGLEDVTLADWKLYSDISTHTHNYLKKQQAEIQRFVDNLLSTTAEPSVESTNESGLQADSGNPPLSHDLSIAHNETSTNGEQSNCIVRKQLGSTAQIVGNKSIQGGRQWNTITV